MSKKLTAVQPTHKDSRSTEKLTQIRKRVRWARVSVLICLICSGIACSYGSYRLLSDLEHQLATSQYDYISTSFEAILTDSIDGKVSALQVMGHLLETSCPQQSIWPNCSIPLDTFEYITAKLQSVTEVKAISFSPLITPDNIGMFEAFAYETFRKEGYSTLGVQEFGQGIYSKDPTTGLPVRDTDASSAKGSREILTPVFEISPIATNAAAVMFNIYSELNRATAIDYAIDCADLGDSCVSVTSPVQIVQQNEPRPASLMMIPVQPLLDKPTVVGVAVSVFFWDSIIKNAVPSVANNVYAVLRHDQNGESFTYRFDHGAITFIGFGDYGPKEFPNFDKTLKIQQFVGSGHYSITLSISMDYFDGFTTQAPIIACVVILCIILGTSGVFISYDYFVKTQNEMNVEIMETKRIFVRYISHEIRTPLNTVHLGIKLLQDELGSFIQTVGGTAEVLVAVEKLRELISFAMDIEESNDCAVGVLNDLINYDKIVVGSLALEKRVTSAWNLVSETVKPFNVQARKRKVDLKVELQIAEENGKILDMMSSLVIIGDDMKLKQVLRNVVSNALKFTQEGGIIRVSATWNPAGIHEEHADESAVAAGTFVIAITDNGVGLSADSIHKLGGEFVQINARDLQAGEGSGLGLWISKKIVQLHGGILEFESAGLGLGTTVRISLPLFSSFTCRMTKSSKSDVCQRLALPAFNHDRSPSVSSVASLDDMPYQVGVTNAAPTPVHPGVRKILIVDDVMLTLKIVSKILTRAGFQCMEANNGSECIEIVRKHNDIDLILMDSEMPVMNGPEAAHILVHGQHCTIPIIGLSGNVLKSDIDYFKGCGAIDVLAKPLQLNELWVHIEKINLDRQQKSNSQRMLNSVAEEAEDGDIKFDLVL